MSKIKKIVKAIKEFFNSIFYKPKVKMLEKKSNVIGDAELLLNEQKENLENDGLLNKTEKEEIGLNDFIYTETEKKDFFRVYNNIKSGIVKMEDLMLEDLIKVQLMMQSESNILDKKISITEEEIKHINNEMKSIKRENLLNG